MEKIRKISLMLLILFWCTLSIGLLFLPKKEFSDEERRKLETFPEFKTETILNGTFVSDLESYSLDHFPLRQKFRMLKSLFHYGVLFQNDNNDIYIHDQYIAKMEYPMNEKSIDVAISKFEKIYNTYLKNNNTKVYFSIVPDKNYFLAEKSSHLQYDYSLIFDKITAIEWAKTIDIYHDLKIDDYYKTDTHWKQEELLGISRKILNEMESSTFTKDELILNKHNEDFYGVYFGQAALPIKPDFLKYYSSKMIDSATVFDYETNKTLPIYDLELKDNRDKYDLYLHGAKALLRIDNQMSKTEKELIVFRDSFGSSLIPLLIKDYKTITVIDTRYIQSSILNQFVDFKNKDILFLYSPLVLNNSTILK